MKRFFLVLFLVCGVIPLAGCTPGAPQQATEEEGAAGMDDMDAMDAMAETGVGTDGTDGTEEGGDEAAP